MSLFQQITDKALEVGKLTVDLLSQAAQSLFGTASGLTAEQINSRLEGALKALRGEAVATENPIKALPEYSPVYSSNVGTLATRDTEHGRQVRLTIKAGQTIREVFDALNIECNRNHDHDAIYKGELYKDKGLDDKLTEDLELEFIPKLNNSNNKYRSNEDPNLSQEALLKSLELDFVDRPHLVAAAAMYKVATGQDLLEGMIVRSRLGAVSPHAYGVLHAYDPFDDFRSARVFASGGASPSN